MADNPLVALVAALAEGSVRVVDLSQPLGPATPVISLPPQFGQSAPLGMTEISRYDERGPAWYWNNSALGEHTGTHFDAPVHWITGRDLPATDRYDCAGALRCSRLRDRLHAECARDPGFLLTVAHVEAWEAEHGQIRRALGAAAQRLVANARGAAFLNARRPADAGTRRTCVQFLAESARAGFGTERSAPMPGRRTVSTRRFRATASCTAPDRFGLASLANLDRLPPTGAVLITPPLKIVNGSGSPCRVLALVPA